MNNLTIVKILFLYHTKDEKFIKELDRQLDSLRSDDYDLIFEHEQSNNINIEEFENLNIICIMGTANFPKYSNSNWDSKLIEAALGCQNLDHKLVKTPIIYIYLDYHTIPRQFNSLERIPRNGQPVSSKTWSRRSQAYYTVVCELRKEIYLLEYKIKMTQLAQDKACYRIVNMNVDAEISLLKSKFNEANLPDLDHSELQIIYEQYYHQILKNLEQKYTELVDTLDLCIKYNKRKGSQLKPSLSSEMQKLKNLLNLSEDEVDDIIKSLNQTIDNKYSHLHKLIENYCSVPQEQGDNFSEKSRLKAEINNLAQSLCLSKEELTRIVNRIKIDREISDLFSQAFDLITWLFSQENIVSLLFGLVLIIALSSLSQSQQTATQTSLDKSSETSHAHLSETKLVEGIITIGWEDIDYNTFQNTFKSHLSPESRPVIGQEYNVNIPQLALKQESDQEEIIEILPFGTKVKILEIREYQPKYDHPGEVKAKVSVQLPATTK